MRDRVTRARIIARGMLLLYASVIGESYLLHTTRTARSRRPLRSVRYHAPLRRTVLRSSLSVSYYQVMSVVGFGMRSVSAPLIRAALEKRVLTSRSRISRSVLSVYWCTTRDTRIYGTISFRQASIRWIIGAARIRMPAAASMLWDTLLMLGLGTSLHMTQAPVRVMSFPLSRLIKGRLRDG